MLFVLMNYVTDISFSNESPGHASYWADGDIFVNNELTSLPTGRILIKEVFRKEKHLNQLIGNLFHEIRHAYQHYMYHKTYGGPGRNKWNDITYKEWDAHAYQGKMMKSLGIPVPWAVRYFGLLDVNNSYQDYRKARARLRNVFFYGFGYFNLINPRKSLQASDFPLE